MNIIVKKPDLGVVIIIPNDKKFGDGKKPYTEIPLLKEYIDMGYEWFLHDGPIDKSDLESRKQLYHDGNIIKKDLSWEKRLMPDQVIKKKHLKRLEAKLDSELEKETPDPIVVAKHQRAIEKAKVLNTEKGTSPVWAEIALENIKDAELEKPLIVEKLKKVK